METGHLPCFILPEHMIGYETANADSNDEWKLFENEPPPIDVPIWIIDKAGAVSFGCRREFGLFALCFKDSTPIAWKRRITEKPGIKFG